MFKPVATMAKAFNQAVVPLHDFSNVDLVFPIVNLKGIDSRRRKNCHMKNVLQINNASSADFFTSFSSEEREVSNLH